MNIMLVLICLHAGVTVSMAVLVAYLHRAKRRADRLNEQWHAAYQARALAEGRR